MSQGKDRSQVVARLLALLCILIGGACCFCGGINSFTATLSEDPFVLPSGEIATPQQVQSMALIGFGSSFVIALFIVLVGVSIWYTFDRTESQPKRWSRFFVILLGCSSVGCMLWGVLMAFTAPLMSSMFPERITTSDTGLVIFAFMVGLIPAIVLAVAAAGLWFFAVKPRGDT